MARSFISVFNLTSTASDRQSKGISTTYAYANVTSQTPPPSFVNLTSDIYGIGLNSSDKYGFYRITISTNDDSYDLSEVVANCKYYQCNSGGVLQYTTYADAKSWLENSSNATEITTPSFIVWTSDNEKQSGNTYICTIRCRGTSSTDKYAILFPENWYKSLTTKYTLTQTLSNVVSSANNGEYDENTPFSITLTPATGYQFTSVPTCSDQSATITANVDGTYTVAFTLTSNTTINASATLIPTVTYTLSQSLTNVTSSVSDGSYGENTQFSIVLTPNTNYEFTSVPTCSDQSATITANVDGTYTVAFTLTTNTTISAIATPTYTLTQTLDGVTSSVANGTYSANTQFSIILTPATGKAFTSAPTCNDQSASITENINGTYTIAFTLTSNTTISATATSFTTLDTTHLVNADCNYDNTDKFFTNVAYTFIVNADSGYYFDVAPTIEYMDNWGTYQTVTMSPVIVSEYITSYSCTLTLTVAYTINPLIIYASAVVIPVIDVTNIYTIYNPTDDELYDLSQVRFMNNVDLGEYVIRLFKVFCNVPTVGLEELKLASYSTGVQMQRIHAESITLDCGSIDINSYFNNSMDYENTDIRLYLPFVGFHSIDVGLCMDTELSIEYYVSILSGDALVVIKSDDEIIDTIETNISYEVPYLLNNDEKPVQNLRINSRYLYGFTPFIEIKRDTSYNTSNVRAIDNKYVLLSTLTGFHTVEVINCTIATNGIENDMLLNRLREGVNF